MKKVTMIQYEKGDYLRVKTGYNNGKVGIVTSHPSPTHRVAYMLAGVTYDDADEDSWDEDDGDYYGDYEDSPTSYVEPITKAQYDDAVKKQKVLVVPGLPVGVRFQGKNLIIGDNVVTPTNAKKLAEFITKNTKGKK